MEPTVWFYKEEIYNELCTLSATWTATPEQVPPYFYPEGCSLNYLTSRALERIFNASYMKVR